MTDPDSPWWSTLNCEISSMSMLRDGGQPPLLGVRTAFEEDLLELFFDVFSWVPYPLGMTPSGVYSDDYTDTGDSGLELSDDPVSWSCTPERKYLRKVLQSYVIIDHFDARTVLAPSICGEMTRLNSWANLKSSREVGFIEESAVEAFLGDIGFVGVFSSERYDWSLLFSSAFPEMRVGFFAFLRACIEREYVPRLCRVLIPNLVPAKSGHWPKTFTNRF